jgi:hypothetical protein
MSSESLNIFRRTMVIVCCLFGLPGNILTIIVCIKALYQRSINFQRKVFHLYLVEISILGKLYLKRKRVIISNTSSLMYHLSSPHGTKVLFIVFITTFYKSRSSINFHALMNMIIVGTLCLKILSECVNNYCY